MHTKLDEEHDDDHDDHDEGKYSSSQNQLEVFQTWLIMCCCYCNCIDTSKHNNSLIKGQKNSSQGQGGVQQDDDDIEYDGELEIHHNIPKANVSILYSSLLQKQSENHLHEEDHQTPNPPLPPPPVETNNPLHSPVSVPQVNSNSLPAVSELSSPTATTKNTSTTKNDPNKRSLSTSARLQRFVASKMAATSTGQELMTQALSEEAQMIIHWLIDAIRKYSSEEKAHEIMEHFMKLVSKIAIFYSDGKLSSNEIQQFSESIMPVFTSIYICLNCSTVSVLGGLDKLIENIQKFHETSLKIIKNLMSEKNSSRFTKIIEFVQKKEFLITVFTSSDFEENRNELKRIIRLLTE